MLVFTVRTVNHVVAFQVEVDKGDKGPLTFRALQIGALLAVARQEFACRAVCFVHARLPGDSGQRIEHLAQALRQLQHLARLPVRAFGVVHKALLDSFGLQS